MNAPTKLTNLAAALTADTAGNVIAAITPPQFDVTKSLATMDAVQRALGNMAGNVQVAGPTGSLTAADAGKRAVCLATTLNLPSTAGLPLGASFPISFSSGAITTITPAAGDTIFCGETLAAGASATATNGSHANIVKVAANTWCMLGTAALPYEHQFARSLTTNGYQMFPGGLILQWGQVPSIAGNGSQTVTYAMAFPNACLSCIATAGADNVGKVAISGVNANTFNKTAFVAYNTSASVATQPGLYIALGF
jgi:hypothetical protein